MNLRAAPEAAPPTTHGMPISTWPSAPATTQPSASAVWPAVPHHCTLRADCGPLIFSWSMAPIASLRTLPNSKVSAASITSCSTARLSLVSCFKDVFSMSIRSLSREALVASVNFAIEPTVRRSTLFWSLDHSRIDTIRTTGSMEPVAKYLPHSMSSGAGPESRSEEHTSELQSRGHLVCRLLLEKKKLKK